jgi:hypothetical protein
MGYSDRITGLDFGKDWVCVGCLVGDPHEEESVGDGVVVVYC